MKTSYDAIEDFIKKVFESGPMPDAHESILLYYFISKILKQFSSDDDYKEKLLNRIKLDAAAVYSLCQKAKRTRNPAKRNALILKAKKISLHELSSIADDMKKGKLTGEKIQVGGML